jgi:tetratricopeptide (TPR) repeat protein
VRAIGAIVETARAFAREQNVPLVDFVADVNALAAARSTAAIPGAELFLDHVHPTIEANRELARRLAALVAPGHPLSADVESACSNTVYATVNAREQGIALRNVAKVLSWAGKSADAARLARDAAALLGEDAECHFLEAVAAEEARDDAATEDHYRRATELDPIFWKAWNNLGVLYSRQKRYDEALACYERVARGDPGRPNIHFNLGRAYLRKDRAADAATAFGEAVARTPDDADAWFLLGEAREQLDRRREAAAAYRRAARLDPDDAEAAEAARRMEQP